MLYLQFQWAGLHEEPWQEPSRSYSFLLFASVSLKGQEHHSSADSSDESQDTDMEEELALASLVPDSASPDKPNNGNLTPGRVANFAKVMEERIHKLLVPDLLSSLRI